MSNTPNLVFREDGTILVKNCRLSYEHVFEAWAKKPEEKKKFSGKFLMPKSTHDADAKALGVHAQKMAMENLKAKVGSDKLFIRNGDDSGKPEQEGHWVISASETKPPKVIRRDKTPVRAEDDLIYSGCYVNVLIRPWPQNNEHGKRINAGLMAVQHVKEGERFSGQAPVDTDTVFDDISESFGGDDVDPFA